ncbi:cytochrome P450 [Solihabitans fulvus]|uniref:Cytochrome P450 n=1 Tax=Solihabitans fulvus TaxID=1892852 RepID=A0A5B2XSA4_9PSEU|nr:cytochrome P450 [Solihabitans fulvus]KAA2265739.1 cytochrome P450 [Solihabitans fulvus]
MSVVDVQQPSLLQLTDAPLDLATLGPAFNQDPYPFYKEMRETGPVREVVLFGLPMWLITRYEEAKQALADPRIKHDRRHATAEVRAKGPWLFATEQLGFDRYMLATDAPDHTRLRKMVSKVFTPRRVRELRPRIQEITDGLIGKFLPRGEADLMEELAYPLPLAVISELLGVPQDEQSHLRDWAAAFSSVGAVAPEEIIRAFAVTRDYFAEFIQAKQREGLLVEDEHDTDLLTALIHLHDEGDQLDLNELLAMVFQVLVAGFETTANMYGNGGLALLNHPEKMAELIADPSLLPGAIDEMIRYDAPVKNPWMRFSVEDVPIGGTVIPAGSVVAVNLAAANRDPDRFPDPDIFDIHRADASANLGFSHGPHFCFGMPLAHAEGEIGFGTLLARCENLALGVDPSELRYRPSPSMRILQRLPVTFTPRAA